MKYIHRFIILIFLVILFNGCCRHAVPAPIVISEQPEALTREEMGGKRLTPEILWKFGRVGEYAVSLDGAMVAYTVTRYSLSENRGRTTIWSIPAGGGEAVCLTADVTSNCINPRWLPSGRLAYLGATQDDM